MRPLGVVIGDPYAEFVAGVVEPYQSATCRPSRARDGSPTAETGAKRRARFTTARPRGMRGAPDLKNGLISGK